MTCGVKFDLVRIKAKAEGYSLTDKRIEGILIFKEKIDQICQRQFAAKVRELMDQ